jgi:hypothetical protein
VYVMVAGRIRFEVGAGFPAVASPSCGLKFPSNADA